MRAECAGLLCFAALLVAWPGVTWADEPCAAPAPFETLARGGDESGIGGTGI